jgi:hypothetical protein
MHFGAGHGFGTSLGIWGFLEAPEACAVVVGRRDVRAARLLDESPNYQASAEAVPAPKCMG